MIHRKWSVLIVHPFSGTEVLWKRFIFKSSAESAATKVMTEAAVMGKYLSAVPEVFISNRRGDKWRITS